MSYSNVKLNMSESRKTGFGFRTNHSVIKALSCLWTYLIHREGRKRSRRHSPLSHVKAFWGKRYVHRPTYKLFRSMHV